MKYLKNNFHPLKKLGTEHILSYVHPMAIRCVLVWMAHIKYQPFKVRLHCTAKVPSPSIAKLPWKWITYD